MPGHIFARPQREILETQFSTNTLGMSKFDFYKVLPSLGKTL